MNVRKVLAATGMPLALALGATALAQSPERVRAHVETLASEEMGGRMTGTDANQKWPDPTGEFRESRNRNTSATKEISKMTIGNFRRSFIRSILAAAILAFGVNVTTAYAAVITVPLTQGAGTNGWTVVITSLSIGCTPKVSRERSILPASIFDRSRISLISARRWVPAA